MLQAKIDIFCCFNRNLPLFIKIYLSLPTLPEFPFLADFTGIYHSLPALSEFVFYMFRNRLLIDYDTISANRRRFLVIEI